MARSINGLTLNTQISQDRSRHELWRLRLVLGWTILFAALVGLFAVSWDIQWHAAVGRDRTLTAPHLFILGSIIVVGIAALASILIETAWARHTPAPAQSSTTFAGFFTGSLGAYLVGYGALDAAVAFPLDQYWHTLYGIDVAIWAPFHIMSLAGSCLCCLGVVYMLAESAHIAASQGAKRAERAAYAGVIVALATLMGVFSFLLVPSIQDVGYISWGNLTFTVYPLMFGAMGTFVLIMAIRLLPWKVMATCVALVYLFFGLVNYLLVPQLMTLLIGIEQLNYLPHAPMASVMALQWQYSLIIGAIFLDVVAWIALRKRWSLRKMMSITFVAALLGVSLAALCFPFFILTVQRHSTSSVQKIVGSSPQTGSSSVQKIVGSPPQTGSSLQPQPYTASAISIIVFSLLLGLPGTCIGYWFGMGIGDVLRKKE